MKQLENYLLENGYINKSNSYTKDIEIYGFGILRLSLSINKGKVSQTAQLCNFDNKPFGGFIFGTSHMHDVKEYENDLSLIDKLYKDIFERLSKELYITLILAYED